LASGIDRGRDAEDANELDGAGLAAGAVEERRGTAHLRGKQPDVSLSVPAAALRPPNE
jgi:hypothetical protein